MFSGRGRLLLLGCRSRGDKDFKEGKGFKDFREGKGFKGWGWFYR